MVKNWLGRNGLHYIESLTEGEKEVCSTLEGLCDTLATKFRPQYNETIKSLQFRKLYRFDGESVDEWMGRLHLVAVKSNNEQRTSEGVLAWAKRVEAQWVQAAILNDITELCQFNKIKKAKKSKDSQIRQTTSMTGQCCPCRYCSRIHGP